MSEAESLPLLKVYVNKVGHIFEGYVWIMIQHLLGDFIPFIRALEQMGLSTEDTFIIGIPYSSKQSVIEQLQDRFKVFTPSFPIDECVVGVLSEALDICENTNKSLIIIEDGGYASVILHNNDEIMKKCQRCKVIVEQTKQGVWRAQGLKLQIPICTIAYNKIKDRIEAPEVGKAIVRNITSLLRRIGFLPGKKALVIGYGAIGEATAQGLRDQNAIVSVADSDSVQQLVASFRGFETGTVSELLGTSDMVIGTTGSCTIGSNEIPKLKNGAILVNASSKRVEIDIDAIEGLKKDCIRNECGKTYTLIDGKEVLLLGDGFPINFLDESVPDKIFDLILTELLMCTVYAVANELEPGIYTECVDENEIAAEFQKIHF